MLIVNYMYSQTLDHFRIASTTCQQRPLFWGPILNFFNKNDLLTLTIWISRGLYSRLRYKRSKLYSVLFWYKKGTIMYVIALTTVFVIVSLFVFLILKGLSSNNNTFNSNTHKDI